MIAVKLMGGLGNQMFQYALGRAVSLRKNTDLALDLNFYNEQAEVDTPRHYELDCYAVNPTLITEPLIAIKPRFSLFSKAPYFNNTYAEKQFPFNEEVFNQPNNTLFIGYWQTEKYFIDIRDQLLADFTLKNSLSVNDQSIADQINAQTSVSLHVRRGDYVSNSNANKFHGLKDIEYYKQALRIMDDKVGMYKLFVFSDDIDWCKQNLASLHNNIVFVDGKRDGSIDMHLMKQCSHNIIANSSFSWWAAWLNENLGKIVVAPKQWFNDANTDTSDIIPTAWQKI